MKCIATVRSALTHSLCYFLLYVLRMFGLAPFSFRRSITRDNPLGTESRPFRPSIIGQLYNSLLLIPTILTITSPVSPTKVDSPLYGSAMSNTMYTIVSTLQTILGCVAACLVLGVLGFRQKKAVRILNTLFEVSDRLSAFRHRPTEKWVVLSVFVHFALNVIMLLSFSFELTDYAGSLMIFWVFLGYIPCIMTFWFVQEYSMIVGFLAWKLQTINQCLQNYQLIDFPSRRLTRRNVSVLNCNDRLSFIRFFRSVRSDIVDLCGDVADFFAIPMIFCVTYIFVELFFGLYSLFETAVELQAVGGIVRTQIYWILADTLLFVYPLVSLSLNVTRVGKEAGVTARIVHKLSSAVDKGLEVRGELEQFSQDLRHDDVDVFTAYGLFTLNSTLIPSILGGTATYFIVLLQLRTPSSGQSQPCDCNFTSS